MFRSRFPFSPKSNETPGEDRDWGRAARRRGFFCGWIIPRCSASKKRSTKRSGKNANNEQGRYPRLVALASGAGCAAKDKSPGPPTKRVHVGKQFRVSEAAAEGYAGCSPLVSPVFWLLPRLILQSLNSAGFYRTLRRIRWHVKTTLYLASEPRLHVNAINLKVEESRSNVTQRKGWRWHPPSKRRIHFRFIRIMLVEDRLWWGISYACLD